MNSARATTLCRKPLLYANPDTQRQPPSGHRAESVVDALFYPFNESIVDEKPMHFSTRFCDSTRGGKR